MRGTRPSTPPSRTGADGGLRTRIAIGGLLVLAIAAIALIAGRFRAEPSPKTSRAARSAATMREAPARTATEAARETVNHQTAPVAASGASTRASFSFFAPWGTGLDQVGRDQPSEGNPMGPMSLAADGRGGVLVLDEINRRIVRRGADGRPETSIALDLRLAEDIAVGSDGSMAVLDRHGDKQVAVYDASGVARGKLPLGGEGVPDPGEVTGVFVDGSDVYVERRHEQLVKIGDTRGKQALPRSELAGRPSRDGESLLRAAILDAKAGTVAVSSIERASGKLRFTREIKLWPVVRAILLLETDSQGTIYFAAEVQRPGAGATLALSCLEPETGLVIGGAMLPANTLPDESFRDFTVLESGGVIYALRSEAGVTYRRYDCV